MRIIRFVVSGSTATFVTLVLVFILTDVLNVWYALSSTVAFFAGTVVSFTFQKFWTFGDYRKRIIKKQYVRHLLVSFAALVLNTLLMYLLVDVFGIYYLLSQLVVVVPIAAWTFFLYQRYVFFRTL